MSVQFILFNFDNLLFLRFLPYLSRVFSASKKNPCYFCDFCNIWGGLGPFLVSSFSKSRISFICYFLAIFAIFVTGVFSSQEKSLLLLRFLRYLWTLRGPSWLLCFVSLQFSYICYFCDFCDICHGCF